MIKRIPISELKVGMYVHDLNCSWRIRPLSMHHFLIDDDGQIDEITQLGAREVYIDTALGHDLPGAPSEQDIQLRLEQEVQKLADRREIPIHYRLANRAELENAQQIHRDASHLVDGLMNDVRLGRQIEFDSIKSSLGKVTDTMLESLGTLVELGQLRKRDNYTFEHSVGVGIILTAFAKTLGLNRRTISDISIGGLLHDIGKMKVSPEVLNKPGRLTADEFDEVKRHVEHGADILRDADWLSSTAFNVMAHHHERYDGSGYPYRLKGPDISPVGQMAAIADVYDAITSTRVYHAAMSPAEALRKLQEWSHFHFNGELVAHFIVSMGIYPLRTLVRLESGLLGVVVEQNASDLGRPVLVTVYDAIRKQPVSLRTLDLRKSSADRITGCESPERFGIDIERVLQTVAA